MTKTLLLGLLKSTLIKLILICSGAALASENLSLEWKSIAKKYDTFFVDVVGVVYDGISPYPEAVEALNNLGQEKNIIFISNNPRPSNISLEKLKSFGLSFPIRVVTSGDFARHSLMKDATSVYYHWGAQKNNDILKNIEVLTTDDLNCADKVLLTAFLEDDENTDSFNPVIEKILHNKLPVYCANPDKKAIYGQKLRVCAGFFADILNKSGADVYLWGKPETDIFSLAREQYAACISDNAKCLMIGDTLETDILAANRLGIDSLLVLSGISGMDYQLNCNINSIPTGIAKPTYILPHLG